LKTKTKKKPYPDDKLAGIIIRKKGHPIARRTAKI
jgi:DNA-directed RNA polymerase specialized sigma54-like protein